MTSNGPYISERLDNDEDQISETSTDLEQGFAKVEDISTDDESFEIIALKNEELKKKVQDISTEDNTDEDYQNIPSDQSFEIITAENESDSMSVPETNASSFEDMDLPEELITTITESTVTDEEFNTKSEEISTEHDTKDDTDDEGQNFPSRHNQTAKCDANFEIGFFDYRLESLSIEDRKSTVSDEELNTKAEEDDTENRTLENEFGLLLSENIAIPEELYTTITESSVTDEEFLDKLKTLAYKLNLVNQLEESKSTKDERNVLNLLKVEAVLKIRKFFLDLLNVNDPMTDNRTFKNEMLKHKLLFRFIMAHEKQVEEQIRDAYIYIMNADYDYYFRRYSCQLELVQLEESVTKEDLMGIEEEKMKLKSTIFTIGERGDILNQQLEAPIIVPNPSKQDRYTFEAIFRSEQYGLLEKACHENLILTEFFMVVGIEAQDLLNQIMENTFKYIIRNLENRIKMCYDIIAMFLCIQLISQFQLICQKRRVPISDQYWESIKTIIWSRYEDVFRLNMESIRNCDLTKPLEVTKPEYVSRRDTLRYLKTYNRKCDPNKFFEVTKPHYITRRYAEFVVQLIEICDKIPNKNITLLLLDLQKEVEKFILRMADIFPERKERFIFLTRNYEHVLGVLTEHKQVICNEAKVFRELLNASSSEYAKIILLSRFCGIISSVERYENLLQKKFFGVMKEVPRYELDNHSQICLFSKMWRKSLDDLIPEILRTFPPEQTGSLIVRNVVDTLLQYLHRFNEFLSPNTKAQLAKTMAEIENYKHSF